MKKILILLIALCVAFSIPSFAAEEKLDKSGMTASASTVWRDSQNANCAIDGKDTTSWHSHPDDKNKFPVTFDVDFGKEEAVSGIYYYARYDADGNCNGVWSDFDVEISSDGKTYSKAVNGLSTEAKKDAQRIDFGKTVQTRYMRFTINEGSKGYATCMELEFIKGVMMDKASSTTTSGALDKSGMTAKASTVWRDSQNANCAIDGKDTTSWHSHPDDKNKFPVTFDVDFGKVEVVNAIKYLPRVDAEGNMNGVWTKFDVEVSIDGVNYTVAVSDLSVENKKEAQIIAFGKSVKTRYIRFTIKEGSKGYVTCMELDFLAGTEEETQSATPSSGTGKNIDRTGWKVYSSSSYEKNGIEKMLDGNVATYWHSNYYTTDNKTIDGKDTPPYYISIILPSETVISGFSYMPRQDKIDTGKVKAYEVYASAGASGKAVKIAEGTLTVGVEEHRVSFGFDVKAKSVVFVIKDSVSSFGTCAEFNLLSASGSAVKNVTDVKIGTNEIMIGEGTAYAKTETKEENAKYYTDKNSWKISASSERLPHYPAKLAIDGNADTYWHSNFFTDEENTKVLDHVRGPHILDIIFPESKVISGFTYTPRKGNTAGRITGFELYASETDEGEWIKIDSGTFADDASLKHYYLTQNVSVKKLRLKSVTSVNDYGICAEFDVMTENKSISTANSIKDFVSFNSENKLVKIPETSVLSVESSSVWNSNNGTNFLFDGNTTTRAWHSSPEDKDKFPIYLYIDLDRMYEIPAIDYYARVDGENNINGVWTDFNIRVSADGENYETVSEHLSLEVKSDVQRINFKTPIKAKFIEIEILKGTKGYATCGELVLYEKVSAAEDRKNGNYYTLKIGDNTIKSSVDGTETEKQIDVAPFIDDGRTMIPLRGLLEEMGAEITWDGAKRKIGITTNKVKIELQIMNDLCYVTDSKYGRVRYTLDVPPIIKDGRTFIPVRFVTEQLGYKVSWDGTTQTVKISE